MKLYKLSLIWILLSVALFGCSDEKGESLKTISGKVIDSNTGRGVSAVSVRTGNILTQTDNNGMYLLSDLASGQYVVTFEKTGYETEQFATAIMGRDVVLDCELKLLPEESNKSISGRVTDSETGNPIGAVTVSVGTLSTTTNEEGLYTISGLKSGTYNLTFSKSEYETRQVSTTVTTENILTTLNCSLSPKYYSISGKVTDLGTGSAIRSVTVSTGTSYATTDNNGLYTLSKLKPGEYTVTFSVNEYESRQLSTTITGQNVTLNCSLASSYSSATVTVDDFIAISDGIYYYFKPSSNTKKYYWSHYESNSLPSNDADIIDDLLLNGIESEVGESSNEGYSYNLDENAKYTICVIAVDANDKNGRIVKKEITTKSSQNQPFAAITVNSISGGILNYSIVKNSSCSSYVFIGYHNLTSEHISYPDIVWASYCYDHYKASKDIYTQNRTNITWDGWSNESVVFSLGFNSSGVNGGVISKQYFSAAKSKSDSQVRSNNVSPLKKQEGKNSFNKNLLKKNSSEK